MNHLNKTQGKLFLWALCLTLLFSGTITQQLFAADLKCPAGVSISPSSTQVVCQFLTATELKATITTTGNASTKVRYAWWYNNTNSTDTTSATLVSASMQNLGAATTNTYTPSASTVGTRFYFCVVTDAACGTMLVTEAVQVTIITGATIAVSPSAATTCNPSGAPVTLSATGGLSYVWSAEGAPISWNISSTTGSTVTAFPTSTKTYKVTGMISNGCTNTTKVVITIIPAPTVTANASATTVCAGSSVTLTGSGANTYSWSGGVTDGTPFVINSTATYTVTGTSAEGCTNSAAITISVNSNPDPSTTIFKSSCFDDDGAINLTVSGGTPSYTFSWSNGQTTEDISGLSQGSYSVTVTDANSCVGQITANVLKECAPYGPTALVASQCGQTFPDLSGYFYCNAAAGAQDYQWEFSNPGLGYLFTINRGAAITTISKTLITGMNYGTTYRVRVRAKVGGVWGNYGTICNITIAASVTQVASIQCGQTIPDLSGNFYCDAVIGAQDYQWEFTNAGLGYSFIINRGSSTTYIAKSLITGLRYGTAYDVRVRAKVADKWGTYGTVCTITIAPSATQMISSQCNTSLNLDGYFNCTTVAGAEDYQWEITNAGLGYSSVRNRGIGSASIQKSWFTGLQNGVTYNVRVRAKVGGVWGGYSTVCTITINTALLVKHNNDDKADQQGVNNTISLGSTTDSPSLTATVYPNPSGNAGFSINVANALATTNMLVDIYDMFGKKVYSTIANGQEVKINADGSFAKGVYLVNVQVNGQLVQQKVIIQ